MVFPRDVAVCYSESSHAPKSLMGALQRNGVLLLTAYKKPVKDANLTPQ